MLEGEGGGGRGRDAAGKYIEFSEELENRRELHVSSSSTGYWTYRGPHTAHDSHFGIQTDKQTNTQTGRHRRDM